MVDQAVKILLPLNTLVLPFSLTAFLDLVT